MSKSTKWRDLAPHGDKERKELYTRCGQRCFLLPPQHICNRNGCHKHYRYPICPADTTTCAPTQQGLNAARSRSRLVIAKARHNGRSVGPEHQIVLAKASARVRKTPKK
jgi:hypothetical protein